MKNQKNGKTNDRFAMDEDNAAPTMQSVVQGHAVAITPNDHVVREEDIPSMYLRGAIPGATSGEASEDPNFRIIRDMVGYQGVIDDATRLAAQEASANRFYSDPQYGGVIDAFKYFIIGKGFHVTAQDESEEVKKYLQEFIDANGMDGRDQDVIEKALVAGELFIRIFNKANGKTARIPAIRLLNYWEISKIETAPDDREVVKEFVRPYKDGEGRRNEERIPADEIIHIKFGHKDDTRGLPPFMRIAQSCQHYSDWLFNRIVLNRLKTSYYLEEIVDGTPSAVSSQDSNTPSALKTTQSGRVIKRVPRAGSKITHNKSIEYKWLSPDVKSDDAKEDGRAIRLAICAGAQIPEFILGDGSQANYASTLVAQNPFVRKVEWFQDFFQTYFEELFGRILARAVKYGFLPATSTETTMKEWHKHVTVLRRVKKLFHVTEQFDTEGNIVEKKPVPTKTGVDIQWPNLVTQNLLQDTQAYQLHQAMEIASRETLAQKLGYDFEEEKRKMKSEEGEGSEPDDEFGGAPRDEEIAKGEDDGSDQKPKDGQDGQSGDEIPNDKAPK